MGALTRLLAATISPTQRACVIFSVVFTLIDSLIVPVRTLLTAQFIDMFTSFSKDTDHAAFRSQLAQCVRTALVVSAIAWISGALQNFGWNWIADGVAADLRSRLVRAILTRDEGWWGLHSTGELSNRVLADVDRVRYLIADRVPSFLRNLIVFIVGVTLALRSGWVLSMVVLGSFPIAGDVLNSFTQVATGVTAIGNLGDHQRCFSEASIAATELLKLLDEGSGPNPLSEKGRTLAKVAGKIEFRNVTFSYPSQPDILILNSFSLVIPAGSTAGVIGVSGSGKSTILSLLGRFYEPTSGVILLDDVEISTLNVGWLRRQFGLVAQDSPLLPGSLYHNVAIGHPRYPDSTASAISREKVEEVCRLANAHGFISRLPDRYDTELKGGGHVALSGGQRQRIAIARALIRDPRILLLDEATSLLDIQSESEVRSSLMKIRNKGMTTLIISHRISALLDVDIVVCVDGGKIVEKGTPDDLMKSESRFGSLMRAQNVMEASEKSDEVTPSVEAPTTFSKGTAERSEVELQEGNNEENPMFEPIVWLWVWKRSRPYAGLIISGWIGSLLQGLEFPLQGFFISQVISSYSLPSSVQPGVTYSNAINLLFLGALIFVSKCLQNVGFGFSSAGMIEKLRSDVFKSILGAGPSFFDVDSGSVASVHLMLANDVGWFEKIPGPYFAELMKGFIAIAVGLCVAVRYGSLSLTVTLFLAAPAVVAIGKFQDWFGSIYQTRAIEASELTTTFITTILSHRPIIHRLALEPYYIHTLAKHMSRHRRLSTNHYFASSLLGHPLREALVLVLVSAALWVGGRMLVGGFIENPQNLITVVTTLAITGVNVANIVAGTGLAALNGCGRSMGRLRGCLERGAVVKTSEKSSGPMYMEQMDVDARGVTFSYPSRPEKVLNGFSLTVAKGAKVGIVGSSGSGKSTLIKLLLRFYNPSSGEIVVNSRELSLHPIGPLRAAIAVVSQETDLFNRTFADNIAMGSAGGKCERMEIVEAAIKAKADDFIRKFKMGYEEFVGERGSLLSGGQRQRIAIARACLRRPQLLLLDEFTSALDADTESEILDTVDAVFSGVTRIVVAHRLNTVRSADVIVVMDKGQVAESGDHDTLMARRGRYYEMVVESERR